LSKRSTPNLISTNNFVTNCPISTSLKKYSIVLLGNGFQKQWYFSKSRKFWSKLWHPNCKDEDDDIDHLDPQPHHISKGTTT